MVDVSKMKAKFTLLFLVDTNFTNAKNSVLLEVFERNYTGRVVNFEITVSDNVMMSMGI